MVLLAFFIISNQGIVTDQVTMLQGVAILAAGLMMGVVGFFSALIQGGITANGIAGVGAGHDIFGKTMVLAVFPELYAILAFAATFLISVSL